MCFYWISLPLTQPTDCSAKTLNTRCEFLPLQTGSEFISQQDTIQKCIFSGTENDNCFLIMMLQSIVS